MSKTLVEPVQIPSLVSHTEKAEPIPDAGQPFVDPLPATTSFESTSVLDSCSLPASFNEECSINERKLCSKGSGSQR